MKMTEKQFKSHSRYYDGYCPNCDAITRDGGTEPDAENYECFECEGMTAMGIDYALIGGHLEIVDEEEIESEGDIDG